MHGLVSYEDVSFCYDDDDTPVLKNVSFQIPAGRSVALVGPSGGGKTTICNLLPRFYDVTEGRITIDGKNVRKLTLKSPGVISELSSRTFICSVEPSRKISPTESRGALMEEIIDAASVPTFMISLCPCLTVTTPM